MTGALNGFRVDPLGGPGVADGADIESTLKAWSARLSTDHAVCEILAAGAGGHTCATGRPRIGSGH